MKLTRRQLVAVAAGSVAAAKAGLGQTESDSAKAARDNVRRNGEELARFSIPITTEPAFQFKA